MYQTNKKTGVTYAYKSVSYWDKEKQQLMDLSNQDRNKISGFDKAAASTPPLQVHRALMEHPIATSGSLAEKTDITPATVNGMIADLDYSTVIPS